MPSSLAVLLDMPNAALLLMARSVERADPDVGCAPAADMWPTSKWRSSGGLGKTQHVRNWDKRLDPGDNTADQCASPSLPNPTHVHSD